MAFFWNFDTTSLERAALVAPDGKTISYGDLSDQADAWAEQLNARAGGRRVMIGLDFTLTVEAIAAYIGALRTGMPVLVVEEGQLAADTQMHQTWAPDLHLAAGPDGLVLTENTNAHRADAPHADLRLLLSTSGSTGDPKLVRLSAENIDSNARSIAEYLELTPQDRAASTLPMYYSYGLSVLNSYLSAGASIFLTNHSVIDAAFWPEARAQGVTSLALVPHQFELLENSGFTGAELPGLRYITQAGGKLPLDSVKHFNKLARDADWQLFVMYGQTEAAPRISYVPPADLDTANDTIGRPIPGGRIWLADDNGNPITATNTAGELVYEGPNVMMGYAISRPDLAKDAEHTDLRTGDIAEQTDDGYFRIVGRLKRFVKLFGLRLSLDQIEALLAGSGIRANAVSVDDQLVLLHRDTGQGEAACQIVAKEYDLPQDALFHGYLEDMPLLSSGKPDQKALRNIAAGVLEKALAARKVSQASDSITAIVKRATRSGSVTATDSFASLGGDSLSYLQVQMTLEERLGDVPDAWEHIPLVELEAMIAASGPAITTSAPKMRIGIDVILRLTAITMVVIQHATNYDFYGGTWMLISLMGFSMARFQLQQMEAANVGRFAFRMLYPILPVYFAIMISYVLFRDVAPIRYFTLTANYGGPMPGSLLGVYWFVSLYAQLILTMSLVIAIPALRTRLVADPWASAAKVQCVLVVVIACLMVIDGPTEDGLPYWFPKRGLIECFSVFSLGWMIQCMRGRQQVILTVLLAAATLSFLAPLDIRFEVAMRLIACLTLLAFNPTFVLPRKLGTWLNVLAASTLFVYLFHEIGIFYLNMLPIHQAFKAAIAVVVSFAFSVWAKSVADRFDQIVFVDRKFSWPRAKKTS